MKSGVIKSLAVSHKNGTKILRAGDKVTEKDVNNFDSLVLKGHIELNSDTLKAESEAKAQAEKGAAEKAETKKATKAKS